MGEGYVNAGNLEYRTFMYLSLDARRLYKLEGYKVWREQRNRFLSVLDTVHAIARAIQRNSILRNSRSHSVKVLPSQTLHLDQTNDVCT